MLDFAPQLPPAASKIGEGNTRARNNVREQRYELKAFERSEFKNGPSSPGLLSPSCDYYRSSHDHDDGKCSSLFCAGTRRSSNMRFRMSPQQSCNSLKWCLRDR